MKKQLITLIAIFTVSISFAQNQTARIITPGGFNYKALIIDNGNVVANQSVDIKFTLTTFYGATVVWVEEHTGHSTDANGIVVASIGEGTRLSGTESYFDSIDFSKKMNLTVEVNINGAGYQTLSTGTLKYVPQAKYAQKAGSVDYNYIDNLPVNLDTDDTDDVTKLDDLSDAKATATTTFIGVNAGLNNTASDNVGIGKDALKTNTTSTGNTAVGSGTLKTNTGEYNTAVGIRVLNSNTTGHNNTSVGSLSLYGNTDGYENTAMGHGALNRNTTGFVNVAVGVRSLANNLSGSNNVAIGAYAGYNSTGSNNVFIGKQAGRDETGDNKLYIANSHTATPLIGGDFALETVTINGQMLITSDLSVASSLEVTDDAALGTLEVTNGSVLNGNLVIANGSQGSGKILTSNAVGLTSWQDVSAWDTNASDDFSGNYNDLTNKPNLFYIQGTADIATAYNDNIRHGGGLFLGGSFSSLGVNTSSLRVNRRVANSNSYGAAIVIGGSGTGAHFGVYNSLTDAGSGDNFGIYNQISNTGDGAHYGSKNYLSGTGTGYHYGINNVLTGSGTGVQYGVNNTITNSGNSSHYGIKNYLSGTGTGNKYGIYSKIDATAGGSHYAIFAEATKDAADVYAGYFVGDVNIKTGNLNVEDKLTAPSSGDSDMKAYAYGNITSSGNKRTTGSSDGYAISRTNTGEYTVVFNTPMADTYAYTAIATITYGVGIGFIRVKQVSATEMIIYTYDKTGSSEDKYFTFVVYKK